MASPARHAPAPVSAAAAALEQALQTRPQDFTPFAALRAIERCHPQHPRLGESARAVDDVVRLRHTPSLAFAPHALDRYTPAQGEQPAVLHGLFLGLFGPNAPLPLHLTEYAIERALQAKDGTFAAFADVFHHRMLSLFYRAWAQAQPTVQAERPASDQFRSWLDALVGIASPHLRERDALPDDARRYHAGRFGAATRTPEGLRAVLQQLFDWPVQVQEFIAEWMRLPADAHLQLGRGPRNARLGVDSVLGAQVRGAQQRVRIRLGPLPRIAFQRFLPGGHALRQLTAAVRSYLGDEFGWELQLLLKADEVPTPQLARNSRLGLDTWIGRRAWSIADADEVLLRPSG
ncbi:type VI secretion system baseplate subunit TssG [Xanthomonas vesicatoria]|uniref:type VI secretion system baseplate subunit TssG n=1 Tax=Xanthomonas vesicatoria TaxID=56460 RepID=UPI001E4416E3|nr:type VI secretion system baseplate subunit TssG [Xanthomonas vesicatoria]MCC8625067.1 type VI secretion system baseplate subunit TssG [Xanthomonas vesicatoria]MDG4481882.1 type VI secretion system baseplate subunit TssG [Xanthomonas vesicatoria]